MVKRFRGSMSRLMSVAALVALLVTPAIVWADSQRSSTSRAQTIVTETPSTPFPNGTPDPEDNQHPSGKDRSLEPGGSADQGTTRIGSPAVQGRSPAVPDQNGRGPERDFQGTDKPGFQGGVDKLDQDTNNGCGNDDDFEDDNEGKCLGNRKKAPSPSPTTPAGPTPSPTPAATGSPTPTLGVGQEQATSTPTETPPLTITQLTATPSPTTEVRGVQVSPTPTLTPSLTPAHTATPVKTAVPPGPTPEVRGAVAAPPPAPQQPAPMPAPIEVAAQPAAPEALPEAPPPLLELEAEPARPSAVAPAMPPLPSRLPVTGGGSVPAGSTGSVALLAGLLAAAGLAAVQWSNRG